MKCGIFRAPSVRTDVERHFSKPSSIHTCECSSALAQRTSASCGHTQLDFLQSVSESTTIIQSGEAPFVTGEEPPPHSEELKHALTQAGGPTQSQLSRPMSSRHHGERLRRKHLLNKTLIQMLEKKKETKKRKTFFS